MKLGERKLGGMKLRAASMLMLFPALESRNSRAIMRPIVCREFSLASLKFLFTDRTLAESPGRGDYWREMRGVRFDASVRRNHPPARRIAC